MTFETDLQVFTEIDDELRRVAEEVKTLRNDKLALEQSISAHMVENQIEEHECHDKDTKIKIFTKKSSTNTFTKPIVYECAQILFGADKAESLVKMIDDRRETKESTGIKRMSMSRKRKAS